MHFGGLAVVAIDDDEDCGDNLLCRVDNNGADDVSCVVQWYDIYPLFTVPRIPIPLRWLIPSTTSRWDNGV